MLVNAKSDIGLVRQTNEDNYVCIDPNLYIVADGMGGHVAGEVASNLVVEAVKNFIQERENKAEDVELLLREAITAANNLVYEKAREQSEYNGMGTTISMVYLKNKVCFWAHVGDSRIYLYRDNNLQQITKDHSLVWDLVANGTITAEEALNHPQRNLLTRAVGVDAVVNIDTGVFNLHTNDKLLLCSDGLTNMLPTETIKNILATQTDGKASMLVDAAVSAGGTDNVTAVVLEN